MIRLATVLITIPALALSAGSVAPQSPEALLERPGIRADSVMPLHAIAAAFAPDLWFAPGEPAVRGDRRAPHDLLHVENDSAVVFYGLLEVVAADSVAADVGAKLLEQGEVRLRDWEQWLIRYYMYYREDYGAGAHIHDLEFLDVYVATRCEDGYCHLQLEDVVASAHDDKWFYNWLSVDSAESVTYPLTLLVELGKHAVAPDRNRDGIFTPGYDINRNVNDAWGIRDAMGVGFVGSPIFKASMAFPRRPDGEKAVPGHRPLDESSHFQFHYILRPATLSGASCPLPQGFVEIPPELAGTKSTLNVEKRICALRFGSPTALRWLLPNRSRFLRGVLFRLAPVPGHRDRFGAPGAETRWDRSLYVSYTPVGLYIPEIGGWLSSKYGAVYPIGDERAAARLLLSYSPSIARYADWYFGAGAEIGQRKAIALVEGGFKVRKVFHDIPLGFRGGIMSAVSPEVDRSWVFLGAGVGLR